MKLNKAFQTVDELPNVIPVFPLDGILLLPGCILPLNIFEPRYLAMIDAALRGARMIGMLQPNPEQSTSGSDQELAEVGCSGKISQFSETGDGRYLINLTGVARFRLVKERRGETPYREFEVNYREFSNDLSGAIDASAIVVKDLKRALAMFEETRGLHFDWKAIEGANPRDLIDNCATQMRFSSREKQALLEAPDLGSRAQVLVAIAEKEWGAKATSTSRLQ